MNAVDVSAVVWVAGGILLVVAIAVILWVVISGGRGRGDRP